MSGPSGNSQFSFPVRVKGKQNLLFAERQDTAEVDSGFIMTGSKHQMVNSSRGSGGMLPQEILKPEVSEMPSPALWRQLYVQLPFLAKSHKRFLKT